MKFILILVAVLSNSKCGFALQCPVELPTPDSLYIEGCHSSPCSLQRGSLIPFSVGITANENTASLTLEIDIEALGIVTPYYTADVCKQLKGRCPVKAGEQIVLASYIPVSPVFGSNQVIDFKGGIPITLRSRIYNASGSVLSCSVIKARIY